MQHPFWGVRPQPAAVGSAKSLRGGPFGYATTSTRHLGNIGPELLVETENDPGPERGPACRSGWRSTLGSVGIQIRGKRSCNSPAIRSRGSFVPNAEDVVEEAIMGKTALSSQQGGNLLSQLGQIILDGRPDYF
jgi:hypothetical protein